MVRDIARTFRSKAKSQSSSVASRIGALVHEAGAVEQDVDRAGFGRGLAMAAASATSSFAVCDAVGGDLGAAAPR